MPRATPPRIRDDTQRGVRDWLKKLPDLTGKSYTRIAEEADLAVTTLTKPANNPGHPHVLSTVTIAKIVDAHGVPPPLGFEHLSKIGGFQEEATPFDFGAADKEFSGFVKAYLGRRSGLDAWTLKTRALIGFGYMPGDVVILDLNQEWQSGDVVCAQHVMPTKTETIWRRYEPPYLIAGSSEPGFVRPISEEMVARKGVVMVTFRPRGG